MAKKELKNIFLSASIPLPERDKKYIETADVIAIRDAVIALATTILPEYRLIWGGHPSITPLINYVIKKQKKNVKEHVILYQTKFFEKFFPDDNNEFENVIITPDLNEREPSLKLMRETMFREHKYIAGVFIGGMEGVEQEYKMFREFQKEAKLITLASTGAAAKMIYNKRTKSNDRFINDYAFASIFQEYLIDKL